MRIISIFIGLLSFSSLLAQIDPPFSESASMMRSGTPSTGFPAVMVRPYPYFYDNEKFTLYLLVEIVYDALQFTFDGKEYRANFTNEIIFREEKSKQSYLKVWSSSLSVKDFESTNRRDQFFLSWDSLTIPPGKYRVTYKFQDRQGKQRFQTDMNFSLPVVKNLFSPSPLFLIDAEAGESLLPVFPARPLASWERIPFNQKMKMFLNIHSVRDSLINISITFLDKNKRAQLFQLDSLIDIQNQRGNMLVDIPAYQWSEGHYELKINYQGDKDHFVQTVPIEVIWADKPRSLRVLEFALLPLQVILPENEFKQINSGSKEERRQKFENFWQSKDPTPQTAFNEIQVEFYNRVDSVNYLWGDRRTPGWRTDPGKIILLYGHPNQVEDRSLDPVRPYMRWTYVYADRMIIFTFEALRGRKSYRLVEKQERPIP